MLCPKCKKGTCKIVNLSRKYGDLISQVSEDSLLPQTELGLLKALHDEHSEMFANQIASELDCSYQSVGKRGKILSERELVERTTNENGRRIFKISPSAERTYVGYDERFDFQTPQVET